MNTLKDTKLVSGRAVSFGASVDTFKTDEGGIGLDPAFYEGSFTYHNGEMYFSNGLEWVTTDPPIIRTPTTLTPTNSIQSRQLRVSPFSTTLTGNDKPVQSGIIYEISLNRNLSNSIIFSAKTTNGTTYNLPTEQKIGTSSITPGTTFYWRARYLANYGGGQIESSFSKTREQVFPQLIDQPSIVTIPNTVTDTVTIGPFVTPFSTDANSTTVAGVTIPSLGYLGLITKNFSEWEAYSTNDLDILTIPGTDALNQTYRYNSAYLALGTSISTILVFPAIPTGSNYYWRARYTGQDNGIPGITGKGYVTGLWTQLQKQKQVEAIKSPITVPDPWVAGQLRSRLEITSYESAQKPAVAVQETVWEIYTSTNTASIRYKYTTNGTSSIFTSLLKNNNSVFGDLKLDPEITYYWRAKYVNINGVQSEYTTNIPVSFLIPNDVTTPTIVTPLLADTSTLEISQFISVAEPVKYYNTTEWEIYASDPGGNVDINNRVYTDSNTIVQSQNKSDNLIGDSRLVPGVKYYWRARYLGVEFNKVTPKYPSFWSSYGTFIQKYNIVKPRIISYIDSTFATITVTDPAANVTVLGPTVTFNSSEFNIVNTGKLESQNKTIWDLQVNDTADTSKWNAGWDSYEETNLNNLSKWTSQKIDEDSVYRLRVKHVGLITDSEWSDFFYFKTVGQYLNAIPDPDFYDKETGVNNLTIGEFKKGGYYSGDMWGYVCETLPAIINVPAKGDITSTITGHLNNIYLPIGGATTFARRKNSVTSDKRYHFAFDITDDLNNTYRQNVSSPLFYIGQVVDVRNKNNPYEKMQGHIVKAYGTKITVAVYNSEIGVLNNGERSGVSNSVKWCIMSRYSLFISDANKVPVTKVTDNAFFEGSGVSFNANSLPPAIPYEAFSYTEGYRATRAYSAVYKTPNVEAKVAGSLWQFLSTLNTPGDSRNNGYTDWYMPSRDELVLVTYYYTSLANVTHFTSATTGYKRFGSLNYVINESSYSRISLAYTMYGSFPDTSDDWMGYNRNSVTPQNEFNWPKLDASIKLRYPLLSTLPANPDYTLTPVAQKLTHAVTNDVASTTFLKKDGNNYYPLVYTPPVNKYDYNNAVVPYYSNTEPGYYGNKQDYVVVIKSANGASGPLSHGVVDATTATIFRPIRREIY
jgi:hypothetical protein